MLLGGEALDEIEVDGDVIAEEPEEVDTEIEGGVTGVDVAVVDEQSFRFDNFHKRKGPKWTNLTLTTTLSLRLCMRDWLAVNKAVCLLC